MNKYFFILSCSLIFFCQAAFAQHLMLRICNEERQGIPLCNVLLPDLSRGGLTDSLGICQFRTLPRQLLKVRITCLGYAPYSGTINLTKVADTLVQAIVLQEQIQMGNEVVVTGNLRSTLKSASIVPVESYSMQFLQKNPTQNLLEAVQGINGVRPQIQCNVCSTGDIHINGMEGPYTMVLIDGMPIVSGLSTVYGLSGIPNSVIQRLEVVRGPAAALYGSDAMGGIINVLTKEASKMPRLSVSVSGNGYGEYFGDIALSTRLSYRISQLLSADVYHFNQLVDANKDNFTDLTLSKRLSIFNKWSLKRKNNRLASVALRYVNENRWGGELQWQPLFKGGDSVYGESIDTERYELLASYQLPIKNEPLTFSFSANRHVQDSYYGTMKYWADQIIVFSQLVYNQKLSPSSDMLIGLAHRYTYYDDNTPLTTQENKNKPSLKHLTGFFLQQENRFGIKFKSLVGFRYDYSNIHGHITSPRLALKYDFSEKNTLRLSIGNGFRVVNVFSEDHAALTGGRMVEFTEALRPERSWNSNMTYTRLNPTNWGTFSADAGLFYTYYFNKIVADYVSDPEKIIYANLDGFAQNYGLSGNFEANFDMGLGLNAGLTLLRAQIHEQGRVQEQLLTPNLTANYAVSYHFQKMKLFLDFTGSLTSPMLMPILPKDYRPARSPFFNLSNIQVRKTWNEGLEVSLAIKNLFNFVPKDAPIMRPFDPFDKKAADPVTNPNAYTFDPSYNYASLQGIRLQLGLKWRLR